MSGRTCPGCGKRTGGATWCGDCFIKNENSKNTACKEKEIDDNKILVDIIADELAYNKQLIETGNGVGYVRELQFIIADAIQSAGFKRGKKEAKVIAELKQHIKELEDIFAIYSSREYCNKFLKEWRSKTQAEMDAIGESGVAGHPDADYIYKCYFEHKQELAKCKEAIRRLISDIENPNSEHTYFYYGIANTVESILAQVTDNEE